MRRGIEFETRGSEPYANFYGSIVDVHTHPRLFDPLLFGSSDIPNGKAGARLYSETALRSGITASLAMFNESLRVYNPNNPDETELIPYPITTPDRLLAACSMITQESLIPMGMIIGVDPSVIGLSKENDFDLQYFTTAEIEKHFSSPIVDKLSFALKIFGDDSTGGYNIPLETIIPVARIWNKHQPSKPVILHLENETVGRVLSEWPKDIPVHIAHVSSQMELEAVIAAKERGIDVTCEATPHHMFLTEATRLALGAVGCMKPTLKPESDVKFLWDNIDHITMFASDCAPHRKIDKIGLDGKGLEKTEFGVTNHDVFIRLFLQAVIDGKLTENQLYERVVVSPAKRFKIPNMDSASSFALKSITAKNAERRTIYGMSPWQASPETPKMIGRPTEVYVAGKLALQGSVLLSGAKQSYTNLLRHQS